MPRLRFDETEEARAYSIDDPLNEFTVETISQDCQRRQQIVANQKHKFRHGEQNEYPVWMQE